jgi:signal transduction histidine kinase
MALVHPDDARRVQDVLNEHLRGDRQTFEAEYRVRDHGGRWHWVIDRGRVVDRSAAGAPLRMLGISADVTARRSAEDALREVQSFTTMGRLAARVAHEVNNPLAGIQNAFTLIKDAVPLDHPHRPYVGAIEREIGRIAGVTRQLYETYRQEQSGEGEASVASAVGDAVALLEQLNRESKVRIVVDLAGAPAVVHFPDALLRQAVYNLVQNAVEVSPPGGRIDVTATLDDGCFVLRVADQGPGIPPESRDRVFEPFFSTKPATLKTGGMGLGLSMVRQSVRAFGGRVDIVDLNGKGSEFVVRLPLHSSESGVPA